MQTAKKSKKKVKGRATAQSSTSRGFETKVSAAVSNGIVKRVGHALAFGAAAPHDDFPEGGLRLTARFRNLSATVGSTTSKAVGDGGFIAASSQSCFLGVFMDSQNVMPTSTTVYSVFPSNLRNLATFFQQFRVRSLVCEYVSKSPTSQAGRLALGYYRDPVTAMNTTISSYGGAFGSAAVVDDLENSMSAPLWQSFRIPLIMPGKPGPDDQLFGTSGTGAAYGTVDGENQLRFQCQGMVACSNSLVAPTVAVDAGDVFFEASIDLYGFNVAAQPLTSVPFLRGGAGESKISSAESKNSVASQRGIGVDERYVLVKAETAQEESRTTGAGGLTQSGVASGPGSTGKDGLLRYLRQ